MIDLESQIASKMAQLKISASFVASLDGGLSGVTLSESLSRRRNMPGDTARRLNDLLDELLALQQLVRPIVIELRNPAVTKQLLAMVRDGTLTEKIADNIKTYKRPELVIQQ